MRCDLYGRAPLVAFEKEWVGFHYLARMNLHHSPPHHIHYHHHYHHLYNLAVSLYYTKIVMSPHCFEFSSDKFHLFIIDL